MGAGILARSPGEDRQRPGHGGPLAQGVEFGFLFLGAVRIHLDLKQGWCGLMYLHLKKNILTFWPWVKAQLEAGGG